MEDLDLDYLETVRSMHTEALKAFNGAPREHYIEAARTLALCEVHVGKLLESVAEDDLDKIGTALNKKTAELGAQVARLEELLEMAEARIQQQSILLRALDRQKRNARAEANELHKKIEKFEDKEGMTEIWEGIFARKRKLDNAEYELANRKRVVEELVKRARKDRDGAVAEKNVALGAARKFLAESVQAAAKMAEMELELEGYRKALAADIWEQRVERSFYNDSPLPTPTPEDVVTANEARRAVEHVISRLSIREERVIRLIFFGDCTLLEAGHELDVTRERVRQIMLKALRKLRHPSLSKYLKPFLGDAVVYRLLTEKPWVEPVRTPKKKEKKKKRRKKDA